MRKILLLYTILLCQYVYVKGYSNNLFTISKQSNNSNEEVCHGYEKLTHNDTNDMNNLHQIIGGTTTPLSTKKLTMHDVRTIKEDPYMNCHQELNQFLFGDQRSALRTQKDEEPITEDDLMHYPTGRALRKAEYFHGKPAVHLPPSELIHRGYCKLNLTRDYMQTAVDAFAILIYGHIEDIKRLPADYVLNSARTISMMKLSHEKLQATWSVVRGRDPSRVTYETLEKYRPLFQHVTGKEIARLNLTDHRIVNFIGTHPDLDRHQVGVVASKYIKMNKHWSEPKYLNIMNNLLCGVPMTFMRNLSENTYLQLSHQVFYHTRACDPLQIRFYLSMMTRTQALGKSYSWSAQDVSRLGLLLAEVDGEDLGSIKPQAMAGLSARVAMVMQPSNLRYLTELQLQYIGEKPLNILARKIKQYKKQNFSGAVIHVPPKLVLFLSIVTLNNKIY